MTELLRTRDLVLLFRGVTQPVELSQAMIQGGWAGGQGVMWAPSSRDGFFVTYADGSRGAGYLFWGSDEDSDQFLSSTDGQVLYGAAIMGSGSSVFSTRTFEHYTYASRLAGPLVSINYLASDKLYWSLRGLWTREDEWLLSGDPRAPNTNQVGWVVQAPSTLTNGFLTVQTTI